MYINLEKQTGFQQWKRYDKELQEIFWCFDHPMLMICLFLFGTGTTQITYGFRFTFTKKKYWSKNIWFLGPSIWTKINSDLKVDSASSFIHGLKICKTKMFSIKFSSQLYLNNLFFIMILSITCYLHIDYYLLFILLLFSFRPFYFFRQRQLNFLLYASDQP